MRLKMLRTAAGPSGTWLAGKTYAVADEMAKALVKSGSAEALDAPAEVEKVETAARKPAENAAKR